MHRSASSRRPLSALVTAFVLACSGLGFVVAASPASAAVDLTLTAQVSASSITLGESVTDTVTLTAPAGGAKPTGNAGFAVYGPDNVDCTVPIPLGVKAIDANSDTVTSDAFTPTVAGTYRFVASYHGDSAYNSAMGACDAPNQTVVVTEAGSGTKADITLTSQVSDAAIALGESVTDTATLTPPSGGAKPTGNYGFAVYGPDDATCTTAIPLGGGIVDATSDTVTSAAFTPTAVGTYRFVASYHGDDTYNSVIADCNAPNESVVVTEAGEPGTDVTLTSQVSSASITLGESVTDTVTLTPPAGGAKPTGDAGFAVYGPDDAECTTPIPVGVVPIDPNSDTVTSPAFTPTAVGTYRFIASYHGDDTYSTVIAECNAPNETVVVTDEEPGIVDPDPGIVDPDPGVVDPDPEVVDPDPDRNVDGDGDGDGDGDEDGDEHGDDDGDDGDLPDTGSTVSPLFLMTGLALIGAGLAISWQNRPRRIS